MGETVVLEIAAEEGILDSRALSGIEPLLPDHIGTRRWYRSKARAIQSVKIEDALPVPSTNASLLVVRIQHADGAGDHYLLPVSLSDASNDEPEETLARLQFGDGKAFHLHNALGSADFRLALLDAIACDRELTGNAGNLVAARTKALMLSCGSPDIRTLDSFVSRAEQSNTSIIFRERYILKLFRKLEAGINPDIEIGRFLTEHGFKYTPAVLGSLEYFSEAHSEPHAAGILQDFVSNRGDAWKYTLDSIADFFARVLQSGKHAPSVPATHPLEAMEQAVSVDTAQAIGSYLNHAALLGKRTAQLHAILANGQGGPDFVPEPFTSADREQLQRDLVAQVQQAYDLLRQKRNTLSGNVAKDTDELLRREEELKERFHALEGLTVSAVRIRHHGDYHLGQVLFTGGDFMIIDFEGEPARPLEERRKKALAMRDVAGMVRSFQYAAYAALFGQVKGIPQDEQSLRQVEAWAAAWHAAVVNAYLKAYFAEAEGKNFTPQSHEERRILFDAFLLQKALYETAYELNNRPDWLSIPVRGILSLLV